MAVQHIGAGQGLSISDSTEQVIGSNVQGVRQSAEVIK